MRAPCLHVDALEEVAQAVVCHDLVVEDVLQKSGTYSFVSWLPLLCEWLSSSAHTCPLMSIEDMCIVCIEYDGGELDQKPQVSSAPIMRSLRALRLGQQQNLPQLP